MPLYRDVSGVTFAGTAVARVTGIEVRESGRKLDHRADTDGYLTHIDVVEKFVEATVHTDDLQDALDTFSLGQSGALAFTAESAQAAGSDLAVSIGNAVLEEIAASPRHASTESGGRLRFRAYSSDGATSPLSVS